jgi:N-acetylglutamate synthase-like GNAT family acetyltransferase
MLLKKFEQINRNITMNERIKWGEFKAALLRNPALDLQFLYAENKKVSAAYHITEIKQAPVTSVDCGGKMNAWTEIIIQLMEPAVNNQQRPMKVRKALSIIDIVEKSLPLNQYGIVKIEYGNPEFDVRQMYPAEFILDDEELVISLAPGAVQCKAIERGGSCGAPVEKPKLVLKNLATTDACCAPGGGCCQMIKDMEITEAKNHKAALAALLNAEKLPVNDLSDTLENFIVAVKNGQVIGTAGLEIYGSYGLLRSLAVKPDSRKEGIASKLLYKIEELAANKNLTSIYLLTETVPEYFKQKGYRQITRAEVPAEVQASSEFSHVCPQSAIVMIKTSDK